MKNISLEINGVLFDGMSIAENYQEMVEGQEHKLQVDPEEGMIYVFDKDCEADRYFINANIHCALDIIMVDFQEKITAIHTMEKASPIEGETKEEFAKRLSRYFSPAPYCYVFELAAGTAERIGAKVGERLSVDYSKLYPYRNASNIRYAFQLKKTNLKNDWITPLLSRMEQIISSPDAVRDLNLEFVGGKHDLEELADRGWIRLDGIDTESSTNLWMQKEININDLHCLARVCLSNNGFFRYLYFLPLAKDNAYLPVDENEKFDAAANLLRADFAESQIERPRQTVKDELENVVWGVSYESVREEWDEWQKTCYIWSREITRLNEKSKYYGYRLLNGLLRFDDAHIHDIALSAPLYTAAKLNYRWAAARLVTTALKHFSDSQNPIFWNYLGVALDCLNESEAAFYCFAHAWNLDFDPYYANNLWFMGNIIIRDLLTQQNWDLLFSVASVMLSAISDKATVKQQIEVLCIVGLIYEMRNDFEEAEVYYNAAWDTYKRKQNGEKSFWALRWDFPMLYQALMRTQMKDKTSCRGYIEAQLKTFPETPLESGYQNRLPVDYVEGDGHGDHWDTVTVDICNEPDEFFGVMMQNGKEDAEGAVLPEYERGAGLFTRGIGYRYSADEDSASPVESYFLIGAVENSDSHQFVSAFPVFKRGAGCSVKTSLDRINVWGNALEATVEFALRKDGHNQLAFFLPDYCRENTRLKSNTAYRVELGAFAYNLCRFEEREFKIDKGFMLEEEKLRLRKEGKDDNIDSVSVHMTNEFCNIARSIGGWADDISIVAPVEKIENFTFRGNKCLTLWLKFDERGENISLPVFLKEEKLENGYEPQAGDVIECNCWLQGWVHEEHGSVIDAGNPVSECAAADDDGWDFDFEHALLSGVRGTDYDLESIVESALTQKGQVEELCRCPEALPGDADFSCRVNGALKFAKVMTGYFENEEDFRKNWQLFRRQIADRPDGNEVNCLSIVGIKLNSSEHYKIYYNGFSKLNPAVEKDDDELEEEFHPGTNRKFTPQEIADVIANAWRNLDTAGVRDVLADDFEYTSQWVLETMHGADTYLDYLQGKFKSIRSTDPTVLDVRSDEYYIEIEFEQMVDGSKNRVMLQFEIEDGKVIKGCMCLPSFRLVE